MISSIYKVYPKINPFTLTYFIKIRIEGSTFDISGGLKRLKEKDRSNFYRIKFKVLK